jgi:hypothetical protein
MSTKREIREARKQKRAHPNDSGFGHENGRNLQPIVLKRNPCRPAAGRCNSVDFPRR